MAKLKRLLLRGSSHQKIVKHKIANINLTPKKFPSECEQHKASEADL